MKVYSKATNEEVKATSKNTILGIFAPIQNELEIETDFFKAILEKYKDSKLQPNSIYYSLHQEECDRIANKYPEYYLTTKKLVKVKKPMFDKDNNLVLDENGLPKIVETMELKTFAVPYKVSRRTQKMYNLNPNYLKEIAPFKVVGYDDEVEDRNFDYNVNQELLTKFQNNDRHLMSLLNALHPTYYFR